MRFSPEAFARGVGDVLTLAPFRRWLASARAEGDHLVSVATLVRALDREHPDWTEVQIVRRRDRPDGGVDVRILR
jgi:hypothetical protein